MRRRLRGLLVATALLTASCGGGAGSFSEGDRRAPDVEGVLEAASPSAISIDGADYLPAQTLSSFSTYTLEPLPLQQRVGQYVHAGLDGDGRVVWVAAVGAVVGTDPPFVPYSGQLTHVEDDRATFEDGTVLRLATGVTPPATLPAFLHVRISAAQDAVVWMSPP